MLFTKNHVNECLSLKIIQSSVFITKITSKEKKSKCSIHFNLLKAIIYIFLYVKAPQNIWIRFQTDSMLFCSLLTRCQTEHLRGKLHRHTQSEWQCAGELPQVNVHPFWFTFQSVIATWRFISLRTAGVKIVCYKGKGKNKETGRK